MCQQIIALSACFAMLLSTSCLKGADETEEARAEQLFQDGRKALFQGKYELAMKLLKEAVAADASEGKTTYRLNLARAHRYAGQLEEAEREPSCSESQPQTIKGSLDMMGRRPGRGSRRREARTTHP